MLARRGRDVTKSQRILVLYAEGKTTRQIAEIVLGLSRDAPHKESDRKMAYVRAVARQRRGKTGAVQKRYEISNRDRLIIYKRVRRRERLETKDGRRRERLAKKRYLARRKAGVPARPHRRWDPMQECYVECNVRKHNWAFHGPQGADKFIPDTPAAKQFQSAIDGQSGE